MDVLKSQFDRIQGQLAGLTASQKMLSAALVAIMVMSLLWWGRYAATPELEPVLNQAFSDDDITRITAQLDAKRIEYKVTSEKKIMVPADRRIEVIADLGYSNLLPRNTSNGFDEIIKQLSPMDGQDKQNNIFNHGKEVALERVLVNFPGVVAATVIIDPKRERIIGGNIEPTATVTLATRDGARPGKQLVTAAANVVAGAQAGMSLGKIKVVVNGVLYPVRDPGSDHDNEAGDSLLELQQMAEAQYTRKLEQHFAYIDGVRVSVTVRVNPSSKHLDSVRYEKEKSLIVEQESTSNTREDTGGGGSGSGEAGALPNIGIAIAAPTPSSERTSTESKETIKNLVAPGMTKEEIRTPAGEATPVGASVRVPRSYFVNIARSADPDGKAPDSASLKLVIDEEMVKIRKDVLICTSLHSPDEVSVETYADAMPIARSALPATSSAVTVALAGHVKEIGLGVLALVSLFMMSMVVRKGSPTPILAVAAPAAGQTQPMPVGELLAGEAAEGGTMLDGMELDEDAVKTQQMLEQVSTLVAENPDSAATLVKRWLNQR